MYLMASHDQVHVPAKLPDFVWTILIWALTSQLPPSGCKISRFSGQYADLRLVSLPQQWHTCLDFLGILTSWILLQILRA